MREARLGVDIVGVLGGNLLGDAAHGLVQGGETGCSLAHGEGAKNENEG
jgi:hypothetical protein